MPQEKSIKNQRSHHRYSLDRKMAWRLSGESRQGAWKQGLAMEMSATGIRLTMTNPPAIGTELDVVMDWPGIYHDRQGVRLFLSGMVCRNMIDGVALRITNHDFRFAPVEVPARFRRTERKLAVA
jgi:hypothetical protein